MLEGLGELLSWGWTFASWVWPVLLAIPGFIAFIWQYNDRKARLDRDTPVLMLRSGAGYGFKSRDGFDPIVAQVRNPVAVPIKVVKLEILSPKGATLDQSRKAGIAKPSRYLAVNWIVAANSDAPSPNSAPWTFYISVGKAHLWGRTIKVRYTYVEQTAVRREKKVTTNIELQR